MWASFANCRLALRIIYLADILEPVEQAIKQIWARLIYPVASFTVLKPVSDSSCKIGALSLTWPNMTSLHFGLGLNLKKASPQITEIMQKL